MMRPSRPASTQKLDRFTRTQPSDRPPMDVEPAAPICSVAFSRNLSWLAETRLPYASQPSIEYHAGRDTHIPAFSSGISPTGWRMYEKYVRVPTRAGRDVVPPWLTLLQPCNSSKAGPRRTATGSVGI
ncbi:hypothetical protein S40288_11640 [Stachybotrys chartarum IBT 40288]|nr:hypothetical protein S40288_11640 [Stachybotrys chartarum IBT 40288]